MAVEKILVRVTCSINPVNETRKTLDKINKEILIVLGRLSLIWIGAKSSFIYYFLPKKFFAQAAFESRYGRQH
jgi:hypothetical protein